MRKRRVGASPPPAPAPDVEAVSRVYAARCGHCHVIDGDGDRSGLDLTRVGARRSAEWLHRWIAEPTAVDPEADMPAFGDVLTDAELAVVVAYLSKRR